MSDHFQLEAKKVLEDAIKVNTFLRENKVHAIQALAALSLAEEIIEKRTLEHKITNKYGIKKIKEFAVATFKTMKRIEKQVNKKEEKETKK